MENLLERLDPDVLSARDMHGYTAAHWAALDGHVSLVRCLVRHSAPVDLSCLGTQGPRPIHWACRKGHVAVAQVLLQAGVSVNAADFKGNRLNLILPISNNIFENSMFLIYYYLLIDNMLVNFCIKNRAYSSVPLL